MKRLLCIVSMFIVLGAIQTSAEETNYTAEETEQGRFVFSNILEECKPFDARTVMEEWEQFEPKELHNPSVKMYRAWSEEKKLAHQSNWYKNPKTGQVVLVLTRGQKVTVYGFRKQNCYFN